MLRCIGALATFTLLASIGASCTQSGPGTPTNCGGVDLTGQTTPAGVTLSVQTVVEGADQPVSMAFAPDGRLFYTEKATGRVRVVTTAGQLLDEPFVDVPANSSAERGLLGIALHPEFANNGFVYVFYSRSSTGDDSEGALQGVDTRVVRFTASGNVAADEETVIITLPVSFVSRHNGGNIHFGPDGKLYVTEGDIYDSNNSQRLDVLPGRILRLNDDGSIPGDNPFGPDNPTYALGLRNSFDFTFDPLSDTIFATENGTNFHDEVNRLPAASNGGWPLVEGCSNGGLNVASGAYVEPLVSTEGTVVPTGIVFVPNSLYGTATQNQLLVAEYEKGRILRYTLSNDRTQIDSAAVFAAGFGGGLTDLEIAPDGTLYASTLSPGAILRIVPAP